MSPYATMALGSGLLPRGATGKHRADASSALPNSKGLGASAPKQTFSPLTAGSQRQLFSTSKGRNPLTRGRAKAGGRPTPVPSGIYVLLSTSKMRSDVALVASQPAVKSSTTQLSNQQTCALDFS